MGTAGTCLSYREPSPARVSDSKLKKLEVAMAELSLGLGITSLFAQPGTVFLSQRDAEDVMYKTSGLPLKKQLSFSPSVGWNVAVEH